MSNSDLRKSEEEGVEFYTHNKSGVSGMSMAGLARFVNIAPSSIGRLLEKLSSAKPEDVKSDILRPFAGKTPFLDFKGTNNLKIVSDEVCGAVIEYYAFESSWSNKLAQHAYRRFAAKGIRAEIQNMTGYVQPLVNSIPKHIAEYYIAEHFLPWSERFPEKFFKELYRLRGWDYSLRKENKPYVVGKYINDIVYCRLPPGVMEALKEQNPLTEKGYRPHRYHQLIAEGQGQNHLEKQILAAINFMSVSDTWEQFMDMLDRATPKQSKDSLTET